VILRGPVLNISLVANLPPELLSGVLLISAVSRGGSQVDWRMKMYMVGKLLQLSFVALALITRAGDVELNPGFRRLTEIKETRGLKVAHLNVGSLRNKVDLLLLEQINNNSRLTC